VSQYLDGLHFFPASSHCGHGVLQVARWCPP